MTTPPLHQQIRARREALKLGLREAAARCQMHPANYQKYESGKRAPGMAVLDQIARGLRVRVVLEPVED